MPPSSHQSSWKAIDTKPTGDLS